MKKFKNVQELADWLTAVNINTTFWGEGNAKSIDNLWDELKDGEVALQADPPLRLVNVAQILVRRGKQILVEAEQELEDGQRRFRNQPPSEKMKPGESYLETAVRCFKEELGINPENVIMLTETYQQAIRESDSLSYPGLKTQYTFHIIEAQVNGLPQTDFWLENRAYGAGDPVKRHLWKWQYAR